VIDKHVKLFLWCKSCDFRTT